MKFIRKLIVKLRLWSLVPHFQTDFKGSGDAWLKSNARERLMNAFGAPFDTFKNWADWRADRSRGKPCFNLYAWSGRDGAPMVDPWIGDPFVSPLNSDVLRDWRNRLDWAFEKHSASVCLWLMPDDSSAYVKVLNDNPALFVSNVAQVIQALGPHVVACCVGLEVNEYPALYDELNCIADYLRANGITYVGVHGTQDRYRVMDAVPACNVYFHQAGPYPTSQPAMQREAQEALAQASARGKLCAMSEYDFSGDRGLGRVALDAGCVHYGNG